MASINQLVSIKNKTLYFMMCIVFMCASLFLYFGYEDKKENIDQKIEIKSTQLNLVFVEKVFELQNKYNSKLDEFINHNDRLIDAFAKRDRKTLEKLSQKEFEKLSNENQNFEVMCFGLPDMTSFYRAHMPKKFGDDISKVHGVKIVNTLKKRVSGFLVTKLGLFYRVTFPVYKDGKYIGLIAFGINLGFVNDHIYETLDTESAVLVKTKVLKQSKWFDRLEEGSVGRYTVISTNGELIDLLKISSKNIESDNIQIEHNDKIYKIIKKDIYGLYDKTVATIILFQNITEEVKEYKLYLYLFILVVSMLVILLAFVLVKTFNKFLSTIITINDDLIDLNVNLEQRVNDEVIKNREKEQKIFQQAKMVQMGEMIGNIAHQWRQPLSAITSTASALRVHNELGIMEENEINDKMDSIVDKANYLSTTINTFRDFINDDKTKKDVVIQDEILQSISIIKSTLNDCHIDLKDNIDTDKKAVLHIVSGELSQTIINIINNARDALLDKKVENGWIKIDLLQDDDSKVTITIEDNGGGIPDDVMPKIFDPYFTTKHKSQGTGLGLHMSYKIITESLGGKLYVQNTQYGAKFFIELSLLS